MDEPSVMATENALMAAALTPGETVIGNAACEPHVQDLARMLTKMGADIRGIGSNVLWVTGKAELGGCTHDVGPDHIEIGSFMALAGVTGGELRIRDCEPDDLRMIRLVFRRLGLRSRARRRRRARARRPEAHRSRDVGEYKAKVQDGPWPAFPADLTSIALALATQCEGSVLIHEWMFENRLVFTDKLVLMGADITLCDPHRAIVSGPSRLRGERVESPDIRAGMAMLIAGAVRRRPQRDRQHPPDRPRLRAHRRAPAGPRRAHRARAQRAAAGRGVGRDPPAPQRDARRPARRDARAARDHGGACAASSTRFGYGEVSTPAIEYEQVLGAAPAAARSPPTASSTTTARSWRCGRT